MWQLALTNGSCNAPAPDSQFHNIVTGLGASNGYYNVGKNCSPPKRGTGNGTNIASPFDPAVYTRGFVRLRFPAMNGMPVAGAVQLIEYYMPIEFLVMGPLMTNVMTNLDSSAGLLQYTNVGCPMGYSGCITGLSDNVGPTINRPCTAVASGTVASIRQNNYTVGLMEHRQDTTTPPELTFLTQDEVRRLFAAIPGKRDRALFQLAYHHGLRASEVSLLQRDDVHAKQGRIYIPRVKGSIAKTYPLQPEDLRLVQRVQSLKPDVPDHIAAPTKPLVRIGKLGSLQKA